MEATVQNAIQEAENQMKKTVERLQGELNTVRTGRASPALLDSVRVSYYGSNVPVNQVGNISIPEARTIEIRPWDISVLPELEKAILNANVGVTPNNDGKILRLVFPPLNEDRRKEFVKLVKKMAEEFRVSLRNIRRDANEVFKQAEKDGELPQDVRVQKEHKIQGLTDIYIKKVDELVSVKESEIMEV